MLTRREEINFKQARPFIRSAAAFVLFLIGRLPVQEAYNVADAFLEQFEKDLTSDA